MKKRILIIDDDAEFVEAVKGLLSSNSYDVITAQNGKKGIDLLRKDKVDLILLDVMMSTKTEGFEVSKKLKNDKELNKIPVVLLTGIRKDMNLPFGFEKDDENLPVNAILEKPVKPHDLIECIKSNLK